jgi:hypothetical protein
MGEEVRENLFPEKSLQGQMSLGVSQRLMFPVVGDGMTRRSAMA